MFAGVSCWIGNKRSIQFDGGPLISRLAPLSITFLGVYPVKSCNARHLAEYEDSLADATVSGHMIDRKPLRDSQGNDMLNSDPSYQLVRSAESPVVETLVRSICISQSISFKPYQLNLNVLTHLPLQQFQTTDGHILARYCLTSPVTGGALFLSSAYTVYNTLLAENKHDVITTLSANWEWDS